MTATRYRFRHAPIEVDAIQWTGQECDVPRIQALAGDDMFEYVDPEDREHSEDPEATASYRDFDRGDAWKPVYDGDWICRRTDTGRVFALPNAGLSAVYDHVPYTVDEAGTRLRGGAVTATRDYHALGELCDATAGSEHDQAIEATLQWMVAEMSKEADDRERAGLRGLCFSADSVRGLAAEKANLIRRYRAQVAERRAAK